MAAEPDNNEGVENAAILMMALGEEEAANVLRHLGPKEVQQLGESIAKLRGIGLERVEQVIERFDVEAAKHTTLVDDPDGYVKNVLHRALGDDKARLVVGRMAKKPEAKGIDTLKWMDADAVVELLRHEHPQVMAAILVHLEPDQGAGVLKKLPDAVRNDVVMRVATLDGIAPEAMAELNDLMAALLSGGRAVSAAKPATLGGPKTAAAMLNLLGGGEAAVLEHVREADAELGDKLADAMFIFDDLIKLDDKGIQSVLKEIQSDSLVVALKGAAPALRDMIFKNMSSRAAETLREDLDARGPVRLTEVEAQQKEILKTVRRLVDEGQIVMSGGGGEQML
jgi:flagellar motor switch protein FliG